MFEVNSNWEKKPHTRRRYYLAGILALLCVLLLAVAMYGGSVWNGLTKELSTVSGEPIQSIVTVKTDDTIYEILAENGISRGTADDIVDAAKKIFDLSKLVAGHDFVLTFTPNGERLTKLEYEISEAAWLVVDVSAHSINVQEKVVDLILPADYTGPMKKIDIIVKDGDTVYGLLQNQRISPFQISLMLKCAKKTFNLSGIRPGHVLSVWVTEDFPKRIGGVIYPIDDLSTLKITPQDNTFKVEKHTLTLETRLERAQGTIKNSLYESAIAAGIGPEAVMDLTDVFAWDINFFSDIRDGDTFAVLYERYYIKEKGLPRGYGRILAARFVTQGEEHTAFYYEKGKSIKGYYNKNGKSLKKQFLKAPLNYRRISSGFTYHRRHPIYHIVRPHLGVDYAAPKGTPVVALGDGRVVYCGWAKGFGKMVRIHHSGGYTTWYGHLSRFGKSMHVGKHVSQGQVIGYVGATGVATGPHLDFRVKRGGNFVNPSKLGSVKAAPLGGKNLTEFKSIVKQRLVLMDSPGKIAVDTAATVKRSKNK
jgi:murein DD-endopeptidase MepM/ murein hydrolase activator NlpD